MEFGYETLTLLFFIAFVAGCVDTIAGGGGLIVLPTLIVSGMPPQIALANSKLQSTAGTFTSTVYFLRRGMLDFGKLRGVWLLTFCASALGSWMVTRISTEMLTGLIPLMLILIGFYFLLSPAVADVDGRARISFGVFSLGLAPVLGFYDGFFGPGTGSFMTMALVSLAGYGLTKATAHAKALNFASNAGSLAFYLTFLEVYWLPGVVMIVAQIAGAGLGARLVLKKGSGLIRPVIVAVCFLMSANVLLKHWT